MNKLSDFASAGSALLKRIAEPLRRIFTFNLADERIYPAKTVVASLEKGILSVVYGQRFLSRIKIQGIREYSFEEDRYPLPEVFASSLSLAINDLGAARAGISLSIPKAWTIFTVAEFPATVKENLPSVVSYELDRITPLSSEDAFYDFKVLKENEGRISVIVAAVKADFVRPYIEALREKGITLMGVTVNISGMETLCRYMEAKTDRIFIEVTKEGYEGALFLNGFITGAFTGNFSSEDEKSKLDAIKTDIAPLIDKLKSSGKPSRIMVLLKDKSSTLKELLKVQMNDPVEMLNDTDIKVKLPGGYKTLPYAAVGGVLESLWLKTKGLNLLTKGQRERLKSPKALTIILALSIAVMWILYLIAPLKVEERRLQEIDKQIMLRKDEVKKVEALKKEVESLDKEIATINSFKEGKTMALDVLRELTKILPKSVWLSRVRITQATVELEGYASSATGILPKLEASPYFKKAEFASPTFRDARMNADRFNIKMEIEGVGKEEKKDEDEEE